MRVVVCMLVVALAACASRKDDASSGSEGSTTSGEDSGGATSTGNTGQSDPGSGQTGATANSTSEEPGPCDDLDFPTPWLWGMYSRVTNVIDICDLDFECGEEPWVDANQFWRLRLLVPHEVGTYSIEDNEADVYYEECIFGDDAPNCSSGSYQEGTVEIREVTETCISGFVTTENDTGGFRAPICP